MRVRNEAQTPVYFQFAPEADGPWGGVEVPPGTADLGVQLPPGNATVRCSDGDGTATDEVPIEIVEAEAGFVPYYLEYSGEAMTLTASIAPWASRDEALSDPVSAVRHAATGIRPSDLLELGGYPLAAQPVVRLVRDDDVIAAFDLVPKADEWGIYYTSCARSGVSIVR